MLDYQRLKLAIEIHGQCYQLLRWVSDAIDKEFIRFTKAHAYTSMSESAHAWLQDHYQNLPTSTRPRTEHMQAFANFFGTYLETSFDLHADAPMIRRSDCGCHCPCCVYLARGSHLRTKKVQTRDKKRAVRLMEERLLHLSEEEGLPRREDIVERILDDESSPLRRQAAFSTYGFWLLQRLEGVSDGVSLLALWREVAYERTGSPIKGFKLRLVDFKEAEEELVATLRPSS